MLDGLFIRRAALPASHNREYLKSLRSCGTAVDIHARPVEAFIEFIGREHA